jgi:argininosuccinate synthase
VRGLVPAMQARGCTVLAHGATGRGNDQMRFERYTNALAPEMRVYAPWRDPDLLREFPGRLEMVAYLKAHGIEAFPGGKKRYSTDANLAGLSHEAVDLESLETPSRIVEPTMGVWPDEAPDRAETVTVRFERGRAVSLNGQALEPLALMREGMELLGAGLRMVYEAVLDRRAGALFRDLSRLVADQVYDGRYYDPAVTAALEAIRVLARPATATVAMDLYRGNILFNSLTDCSGSLYTEADASMEASEGLNPVSSQGFAEIQGVEARALARAGQIR